MSNDNGYNPLRWDCDTRGCFNRLKRPKIEMFASALPKRCAFGDIDGIAEVNWNFLLLEFKAAPMELPVGQRIMYERMTSKGEWTVFVVAGNAETMDLSSMGAFYNGKFHDWEPHTFDDVWKRIKRWGDWASKRWAA